MVFFKCEDIKTEKIWPYIWFTGINGMFFSEAMVLAVVAPISSDPSRPGDVVAQTASISS